MEDKQIIERINALVAEEDDLHSRGESVDADERRRISEIEVALDQCWDLLRQRRARREFNEDPDDASVRNAETVERYVQ